MSALAVLASALGGCVPYALPPLRVSTGAGGTAGTVQPEAGEAVEVSGVLRREGRTGLSLLNSESERPIDVTAGYVLSAAQTVDGEETREVGHGGFVDVTWFRYGNSTVKNERARGWRGGPSATVELLHYENDAIGGGGSVGVMGELFIHVAGENCNSDGCTHVFGDTAIGLSARVGTRMFAEGHQVYGLASVEVRIPALFGFIWVD